MAMITDVPTAAEFHAAGLSQIYLAWQIAMQTVHDYDQASCYKLENEIEAEEVEEYWRRCQPALANAFSLIQQGLELALKGRIASVSPYLLLGDPADWPKSGASKDISFGEFRTLDAKDLVKVHNCVRVPALDSDFRVFWDQVRHDRNKLMHSVAPKKFDPAALVRTILTATEALFSEVPWHRRLSDMVAEGQYEALGYGDDNHNIVLRQINDAIRHLQPSEAKRFFGFDKKQRSYTCPHCYYAANRDWEGDWAKLAQFPTKAPRESSLYCFLCETTSEVERERCQRTECAGDVLYEGMCLTCMSSQDHLLAFASEFVDETLGAAHVYSFTYGRGTFGSGGYYVTEEQKVLDDKAACAHARRSMETEDLKNWTTVTIAQREDTIGLPNLPAVSQRMVGYWERRGSSLIWHEGKSAMSLTDL